jgi:hypothetical protein
MRRVERAGGGDEDAYVSAHPRSALRSLAEYPWRPV